MTAETLTPVAFDRHTNIGLHHLALKVPGREALDAAFARARRSTR